MKLTLSSVSSLPNKSRGESERAELLRGATVESVMTRRVVTVSPDDSLATAAQRLRQSHFSGAPVVDSEGRVVGVPSEKDILIELNRSTGIGQPRGLIDLILEADGRLTVNRLEQALRRLESAKVRDAMSPRALTVDPDTSFFEAARLLRRYGVTRLPVVSDGHLVGILTREDIVRALAPLS